MFGNRQKIFRPAVALASSRLLDKANHLFTIYRTEIFALFDIVVDFLPVLALAVALTAILGRRPSQAGLKRSSRRPGALGSRGRQSSLEKEK